MANTERPLVTFLDDAEFEFIVRNAPLCAIDFVIRDPDGAVLLGARNNEPAKGFYFVPGGRIRKDERLAEAFRRIIEAEISIKAEISEARYLGVYEHFYKTNKFENAKFGTHYICQAYEILLSYRPTIFGDHQHSEFQWASPDEQRTLRIHPYSAIYLA